MQSANLSGPLKGLRPYQALLGPAQASGLAGGFDYFHEVDGILCMFLEIFWIENAIQEKSFLKILYHTVDGIVKLMYYVYYERILE